MKEKTDWNKLKEDIKKPNIFIRGQIHRFQAWNTERFAKRYRKKRAKIELNNLKKASNKGAMIILIAATTLLLGLVILFNCLTVLLAGYPEIITKLFPNLSLSSIPAPLTSEEMSQAALLTTGINILTVAISLWAGLHIIQVLERGKFEESKQKLEELNRTIQLYEKERRETAYDSLVRAIESLNNDERKDELNIYLADQIRQLPYEMVNVDFLYELSRIEEWFTRIYQLHYDDLPLEPKDAELALKLVEDAKARLTTENLGLQFAKRIIVAYLKLREAEFKFYFGYSNHFSKEDRISFFKEAIENYQAVFPVYNVSKSEIKMDKRHSISFHVYMLNTIGESCSMIIFLRDTSKKSDYTQYELLGEKCFTTLNNELEKSENKQDKTLQREAYYRNHGCFLERLESMDDLKLRIKTETIQKEETSTSSEELNKKIEKATAEATITNFKKIAEYYKKAIAIAMDNKLTWKPLYTYLSWEHKLFDIIFTSKNGDGIHEIKGSYHPENCAELKDIVEVSIKFADLGLKLDSRNASFIKFRAFLGRDQYLSGADSTAKGEGLGKMNEELELINKLELSQDKFTDELSSQYKSLIEMN